MERPMKRANVFKSEMEKHTKRVAAATKLYKQLDLICNAIEKRSMMNGAQNDQPSISIEHVIELMSKIEQIPSESELFMLGKRLFMTKENREMFVALKDPETQFAWHKQEQA
ncbi:hypothetical protein ACH5RR_000587 [Cinchona calisaya]|uniref:Uncharacterized protein n=1 Tax=Cinchona calisaya TaxID=153742 RepID=A0ABD3B1C6_9GENT